MTAEKTTAASTASIYFSTNLPFLVADAAEEGEVRAGNRRCWRPSFSPPSLTLAPSSSICAWLVEPSQPDVRQLDLWLQSDADVDFLIKVDGEGIVDGSGKSNSPESATYGLTAGQADKAWASGSTLGATKWSTAQDGRRILERADAPPREARIQRKIPADEKMPPDTLAKKPCATLQ